MGKEEEKKKEKEKEKTKTWPSDAEREQARKEARSAHEKNRLSWFERSEHKAVRTCVCLCGHTFRSQARDLACATVKKVKDEDGKVVLDKQSGKAKLMRVDVKKCLTRTACPECKSRNGRDNMEEITRTEHLAWCKQRALEYLPDNPQEAFTSMASDLGKHEETRGHPGIELGRMLLMSNNLGDVREFIEGFN